MPRSVVGYTHTRTYTPTNNISVAVHRFYSININSSTGDKHRKTGNEAVTLSCSLAVSYISTSSTDTTQPRQANPTIRSFRREKGTFFFHFFSSWFECLGYRRWFPFLRVRWFLVTAFQMVAANTHSPPLSLLCSWLTDWEIEQR